MRATMFVGLAALLTTAAAPPAPRVDMQRMSEITRVLASDAFQGRAPGTAGEEKTIPYLIEQFKAAGLEPAGEDGGWTQTVPMIRTQLQSPMQLNISQSGQTVPLRFPDDVYLGTVRAVDRAAIANAPMVFVGYGVNAPERGWDDFKGVDLHGKVAVFLVNDPDFEATAGEPVAGKFGGKTMTFYGRWVYKYEEAARRGAIAALIVHETEAAGYLWTVVKSPAGEGYNIVLAPDAQQPVLLQGWIQQPVAAALFKRAGYDYDTLKRQARSADFRPIDLQASLSADMRRIGGFNFQVPLTNVSASGCCIVLIEECEKGEDVIARFPRLEPIGGVVRWTEGTTAGVEFARPIHPAVFEMLLRRMESGESTAA